ncbi:MAG: hemerythrin domain-containing protein [Bacteroidales bacterium]|jgi:regulator of cell morphogenesis and NO signaling|nr:hemerythrin domain-containing protein [Bacteroidales bacterium]
MTHATRHYTADMKMFALVETDHRLLLLLPRFNIELGFGEQSIRTACQKHDIDTDFFLMICNIYSFEDYMPDEETAQKVDVCQLIAYLSKSHGYYLNHRLQAINRELQAIIKNGEKAHATILTRFFKEYEKEISDHFTYEENVVFPYILGVAGGHKNTDYRIDKFEENHTNINDKLSDLKNILIKYLPETSALEERMNLIFNIFSFELDLRKHTLLEDWILVPKVRQMELLW